MKRSNSEFDIYQNKCSPINSISYCVEDGATRKTVLHNIVIYYATMRTYVSSGLKSTYLTELVVFLDLLCLCRLLILAGDFQISSESTTSTVQGRTWNTTLFWYPSTLKVVSLWYKYNSVATSWSARRWMRNPPRTGSALWTEPLSTVRGANKQQRSDQRVWLWSITIVACYAKLTIVLMHVGIQRCIRL